MKDIVNRKLFFLVLWMGLPWIALASMKKDQRGLINGTKLYDSIRQQLIQLEGDGILEKANNFLDTKPITVTASSCPRSLGGKHDFYSEAPYWWPDPANPSGPFIRHDGLRFPDRFENHDNALVHFSEIVETETIAYLLTGKEKYARTALSHLNSWMVDTATRMNPHMIYAQAIKGICSGRGIGIIDALPLMDIARSVMILEKSNQFSAPQLSAVKNWFKLFLQWLTTHPYGIDEMKAKNNHGTWWHAQVSIYAKLVGDQQMLDLCRKDYCEMILPNQMARDGSFPLELERTKPFSYSLFNLDALAMQAWILSDDQMDLWNYSLSDQRGLNKGVDYILPYLKDLSQWPHARDIDNWESQPGPRNFMLLTALAQNNQSWFALWKALYTKKSNSSGKQHERYSNALLWIGLHQPTINLSQVSQKKDKVLPTPLIDRLKRNPIIRPEMLPGNDGDNINGPSLIKVPDWIPSPLGKYYLYFAHHQGKYIRLAYADRLEGPWKIYEKGTLRREDCLYDDGISQLAVKHIASPDLLIDSVKRELVMYFHISAGKNADGKETPQVTLRATSTNGIDFTSENQTLGESYFRVFKWKDQFYALSKKGLYRSGDGLTKFEQGPNPYRLVNDPNGDFHLRHLALLPKGDMLHIFFSRIGDAPEHLLYTRIHLTQDWLKWEAATPVSVLEPQMDYEGIRNPIVKSVEGASKKSVRELRDPAIFEEDGHLYLLYSVAGELGIALANLKIE